MRTHMRSRLSITSAVLLFLAVAPNAWLRADPLTAGETVVAALTGPGDIDSWTFFADDGDSIVVRVGEITQTNVLNPRLTLFAPGDVLLATDSGGTAAGVSITALSTGTYTVLVDDGSSGGNGSGLYRLTLAKAPGTVTVAAGDEGGPLTNALMHTGTIDVGDLDVWRFEALAGDSLVIRVGDLTGVASLDPQLRVYDPTGAEAGASLGLVGAETAFEVTNSGTYIVVVGDGNAGVGGTGDYRLTLARTGIPIVLSPGDEGGALTNNVMHTGTIPVGDLDLWSFEALAGESFIVRTGDSNGVATLDPKLRLYGPDGTALGTNIGLVATELAFRATNSGTHLVVLGDGNSNLGGTGDYRLTLAKTGDPIAVSPGDEGGPLTNGVMHLGSIPAGDLDVWRFEAVAGEGFAVRMGDSNGVATLEPQVRIYDPSGAPLGTGIGLKAGELALRATLSGPHTVVVGDGKSNLGGTGDYRLTLAKTGDPILISPGDEGGSLTNGIMHLGTIPVGDLDVWQFEAVAGESFAVRMGDSNGLARLDPQVRVYGPEGALLDSGVGLKASEVAVRATNSGIFLVVVGDGDATRGETGDYRLTLAKTGEDIEVSVGDESGSMSGAGFYDGTVALGDLDLWKFNACAGEPIELLMEDVIAGPLDPWIRLYGRDGELLNSVKGTSSAAIIRTAPVSGDYTVVVGDGNAGVGEVGEYRLTINRLVDGLQLCTLGVTATNVVLAGVGGTAGASVVVDTTTSLRPTIVWLPLQTNVFDLFGTVSFTIPFDPQEEQRYFRFRSP